MSDPKPNKTETTIHKEADMALNTMKTPAAATPVTILMDVDAFFNWLGELQGIPGSDACNDPDFLVEEMCDPNSPYSQVAVYLNTPEGTVMARHLRDCDTVKVTMRCDKPGASLVRTVRWMLGEEGEAA